MKQRSLSTIKLCFLLLLTVTSSAAFGMDDEQQPTKRFCGECKEMTEHAVHGCELRDDKGLLEKLVVREGKDLQHCLYALLDPMPLDLIKIIVAYDAHDFKGTLVKTIQLKHARSISGLVLLSQNRLGVITDKGTMQIWDWKESTYIRTYGGKEIEKLGGISYALQMADELIAVSFSGKGKVMFINSKDNSLLKGVDLCQDNRCILGFALLPDGRLAASLSGTDDVPAKIFIIDLKGKSCKEDLDGHALPCGGKAMAVTSTWLATRSFDGGINFLDMKTGALTPVPDSGKKWAIGFVPFSDDLCAAGVDSDKTMILNVKTGACALTINNVGLVIKLGVLSKGLLVAILNDGCVEIFNPKTGKQVMKYKAHDSGIYADASAILPNGGLVTASKNTIKIWS